MMEWTHQDETEMERVGLIEFQDNKSEYHNFEVFKTSTVLLFGSFCNIGFLQSGYMTIDHDFSIDENLQELIADLEVYYNDGKNAVSDIVCNERM